jgi:extracellular factor (EF) 3-hydroxypalmitic acid methyl ester biosynthesis protein
MLASMAEDPMPSVAVPNVPIPAVRPPVVPEAIDTKILDYVADRFEHGQVFDGMRELLPALQAKRFRSSDAEWEAFVAECYRHPLCGMLHQDPFTLRSFQKPRGYAGDAVLLDYVYGREEGWGVPEGTTELGRKIFQFTTASDACEAVRARRGFIADAIDQHAQEVAKPSFLSIASGHLREALLCSTIKRRRFSRFVSLDLDRESLAEVRRAYGPFGVEVEVASFRQLLTGRHTLGQFDMVYSTGLYDYLQLPVAQRLTLSLFRMLRPRGRLLIANFLPGILDVGYMESFMAWKLIYRTRVDMLAIAESVPLSEIRDIRIFAEEKQNIIFLQLTRR